MATSISTPTQPTTATPPTSNDQEATTSAPASSSQTQPTSATFTLLLFAAASTHCGTDALTLRAPMSLAQLFEELETRFPGVKREILSRAMLTRNLEYLDVEVGEDGELLSVERAAVVGRGQEGGQKGDGDGKGNGEGEVVFEAGDEVGVLMAVSSG